MSLPIIYIKESRRQVEVNRLLYIKVKSQTFRLYSKSGHIDKTKLIAITENPVWTQAILRPAPPTDLAIVVVTEGQPVNLTWTEISGVEGYTIYYREQGEEDFIKLNETLIESSPYTLQELGTGDYDLYMTSSRNGLESKVSETISFNVFIGIIAKVTSDDFGFEVVASSNIIEIEVTSSDFTFDIITSQNTLEASVDEADFTLTVEDS